MPIRLLPLASFALIACAASSAAAQDPTPEAQPASPAEAPPLVTPAPPPLSSPPPTLVAPTAATPTVTAACSDCVKDEEKVDGRGSFLLGIGFFDLGELNDRLAAADYSQIDGAMTVIGGQGHAVFES
ncbi:MAG TPA: hypothetical protein VJR89_43455, partial [Polyangiales bacterium]|nr:hypothetical protein [Polyangiales bacterium]